MIEKIAKLLKNIDSNDRTRDVPWNEGWYLDDADHILTLLKEEIEKVENPYPRQRSLIGQSECFEICRQKILRILES